MFLDADAFMHLEGCLLIFTILLCIACLWSWFLDKGLDWRAKMILNQRDSRRWRFFMRGDHEETQHVFNVGDENITLTGHDLLPSER